MQQHVVAVHAQVQAEVADEEGGGVVAVLERAAGLDHGHVHARLGQLPDVLHRQVGDGALVRLAAQRVVVGVDRIGDFGDRHAAAPLVAFAAAVVVGDVVVEFVAVAVAVARVRAEQVGQRVVAHAEELHVGVVHVHRHQRQAAGAARRQHAAVRGEADRRRQVAGVHVVLHLVAEGAAVGGEQAGLQLHRIARVRLHEREVQRLAVVVEAPAAADHFAVRAGHRDQRVERLRRGQRGVEAQGQRGARVAGLRTGRDQRELRFRRRRRRSTAGRRALQGRLAVVVAAVAGRQQQAEQQADQDARQDSARKALVRSTRHETFSL